MVLDKYLGAVLGLCTEKRGAKKELTYVVIQYISL